MNTRYQLGTMAYFSEFIICEFRVATELGLHMTQATVFWTYGMSTRATIVSIIIYIYISKDLVHHLEQQAA
jgi:hypothetical protein